VRAFWESVIEPLLEAARPKRIVEIGVDKGDTTARLVEWAAHHGATVDAIDPAPSIDVGEWLGKHGEVLRLHIATSLETLGQLDPPGVALIDGDHNFYTVLRELRLLEGRAQQDGAAVPIIALHDVGWPYGRRDLYYAPERIPEAARKEYAQGGIELDEPGLASRGFNDHLFNAIREEPKESGVLGGIEQFLSESVGEWRFVTVSGDHGLGILAPASRLRQEGRVRDLLDELESSAFLRQRLDEVERSRITGRALVTELRHELADARSGAESTGADAKAVAELQAALGAAEAQQGRLREDLDRERERLEGELASERMRLQAELEQETARTQAELQRLEAERERQQTDVSDLRRASEDLRDELAESQRSRSRLERRLTASEEHEIELEEAVAATRRQLRAAEGERDDADAERQRIFRRFSTLDDAAASAERDAARRVAELEEQLATADRRTRLQVEEAQRETSEATAQANARAEQRVADAQREADEGIAALRRQLAQEKAESTSALEQQLEDARSSLGVAEQQTEAAVEARDVAQQELERALQARASLIADLEDSRESAQERLDEQAAEAETARRAASELREALEARELERAELIQRVVKLEHELRGARADREILDATRTALERRLAAIASENEQLRVATAQGAAVSASAQPPTVGTAATEPEDGSQLVARRPDAPGTPPPSASGRPAGLEVPWLPTEREARARFIEQYASTALTLTDGRDAIALPAPDDRRGVLLGSDDPHPAGRPRVDVIVCVHDALEDVRRCLWSLVEKTQYPFHLIIVDDGSDDDTAAYLDHVAVAQPKTTLIRNSGSTHGYTIAANLGLRASQGDYLMLLNSDTVVTPDWLDRIVDCGESDERIGVLGPLSNAASHQSVPELRFEGAWATNPLPRFVTADGIGLLLGRVSERQRPRIPFINGFCYVIKRAVIDAIGYLDEESFASGYCEENDFSHRAGEAGFELAIVDDGYVYHAKSKSFGVEGRKVIAKRNYGIFLEKYGAEVINAKVAALESDTSLAQLRAITGDALSNSAAFSSVIDLEHSDPLSVVFVLPGLGDGGSGGAHSIYQEVRGLRQLGVPARIALARGAWPRAERAYDDASEVFETFADVDELAQMTADADVISATHFKSVELVAELRRRRDDFLPAYYVQDYEPFFFTSADAADVEEALLSYTLIDDCLLFAKTHWLCNIVAERHGRYVAKVEPSLDEQLFVPPDILGHDGPVRVVAMVRPRTPRRQPTATVAVLDELGNSLGRGVEIVTFGCTQTDLKSLGASERLLRAHRGLLRRAEVAQLLAETDVFVDLSMYQAFGRTALEAMACGSTAVVPRLGGVWEFVEDGVNAIAVDPLDPTQTFEAVRDLCVDSDRVAAMKLAAQATGQRYSILRAALSEYVVFKREHARRLQLRNGRVRS
jgi:GT2 family glycosyltransferase